MILRRFTVRGGVAALSIAVVLSVARPAAVARTDDLVSHPWIGVTYIDRTSTTPRPIRMHVVQIDLGAPGIRFELSPHAGPREVMRQTTVAFLEQVHAQIAINAHFFWPWPSNDTPSEVLGIAASDGMVYSGFESPEQTYALVPDAPGLNIDRDNHATIVHHGRPERSGTGGALGATQVAEPVTLWNTVAGSAQIVTDGEATIPAYRDAAHPGAVLVPGGPSAFSNAHSWYDVTTARTSIGLSKDGRTLTMFTVDVRGGSDGLSVREVATLLVHDFGVWQALNLDGGGLTSMVLEDPQTHAGRLVNASSDSAGGRAVGSNLAVFARAR